MPLGRYNRRDAKNLSKNRFSRLDADIASSYVDDEEEDRPRPKQGTVTRVINMLAGRVMHGQAGARRGKKDEQTLRSAAGVSRNTEMVYKIRIPFGRKFTVPWIMKQLHQQIEDIKPLLVSTTLRGDVEFFLKSEDSADACRAISRRIVHRVLGDRMSIIVDKVVAPWTRLNKEETAVIQTVVDSRYNQELRSLDLSEFALDKQFKDRDLHMMLNKNNVMLTVVDRIDEKFGYITALSLQGNRLRFLDYAAVLTSVTKFLKVLDLSNNQDGAPVQPATVHVQSLDDDEVTCEPPCRAGFYGSHSLRVLVERFLVEYFKLYDGEDGAITRKSLIQAYDQDNRLCASFIYSLASRVLADINVITVRVLMYTFVLLIMFYVKTGGREIGAVERIVEELMAFCVQGLFEDGRFAKPGDVPQLNFFARSFLVSPRENEYVLREIIFQRSIAVLSDMLYISGITSTRMARYKQMLNKAVSAGQFPSTSTPMNSVLNAAEVCVFLLEICMLGIVIIYRTSADVQPINCRNKDANGGTVLQRQWYACCMVREMSDGL
ncbi:hypothetical protein DICVIV_08041 [Dictyocaulus viviparus]|uniref:NTF2 domain-containing protein n=1 Tax=Dictyocaulus viviparus TaxID=29172 RepID=A0A0D8XU35_DICVI|nr:hypothetical protein DICVIV_08041 [Dictyocaulus viviparus]